MRTTIDAAGRVVIPKALREAFGLRPGEVELVPDGTGVRVEPVLTSGVEEREGLLLIAGGESLDDESVRALRLSDQR